MGGIWRAPQGHRANVGGQCGANRFVVQAAVQFADPGAKAGGAIPLEAARQEWFLTGTQQTSFAIHSIANSSYPTGARGPKGLNPSDKQLARITTPTTGTIIALDPDIPPKNQRVRFAASGSNLRWLMEGPSAQWLPWPGRHVVQIVDAKGTVLDEVRLEVRGAGVVGKR